MTAHSLLKQPGGSSIRRVPRPGALKLLALAILMIVVSTACGARKVRIAPAASVPAADAIARFGTDENGNSKVELDVKHLAKAESLTPPATAYVVWVQPRGEAARNQGVLRVDDDLEGQFTAITPYKSFELLVTAEGDPTATVPRGPVILQRELER